MELVERYNLHTELIIVEWNPFKNKKPLKDVLDWSKKPSMLDIRIIQVPKSVHDKLPNSNKMSFFEFIAKNVGILRANGEYVLSTNADIIFNDSLIKFFRSKRLSNKAFYRINRCDLQDSIPLDLSLKNRLKFCDENIRRIISLEKKSNVTNSAYKKLLQLLKELFSSFLNEIIKVLRFIKNYELESKKRKKIKYNEISKEQLVSLDHRIILNFLSNFLLILKLFPFSKDRHTLVRIDTITGLHTGAAGDFTLMTKENWHKLRGYPEFKSQAYTDSIMLFMASAMGLKQIILKSPMRIYHQKHRQTLPIRPLTDFNMFMKKSKKMFKTGKLIVFNDENWGLMNESLIEIKI
ncbi:MAG: hypothetical protein ACFFDN_01605 [Candidatus Hodarchaeota archaeon]